MATHEKPILFSGPMVRAIVGGRKSQTRRVVKPQPKSVGLYWGCVGGNGFGFMSDEGSIPCPYGQVGGRLWVRETWARDDETGQILYRADDNNDTREWGQARAESGHPRYNWRPSIHMPRSANRILLEITSIRVERLQEISEADAKAEGCQVPNLIYPDEPRSSYSRVEQFKLLLESINGPESWVVNPWVWVVEFKVIK